MTAVDGLQAVRFEYETDGDGLWPEGTPVTLYAIDVTTQDTDATLFVDTVGLDGFDYTQNQVVLDRMARTIDVEMEGVDDDPDLVASYLGGGGEFSVEARTENAEPVFVSRRTARRCAPTNRPRTSYTPSNWRTSSPSWPA